MNRQNPETLTKVAQKYLSLGIIDGGNFYLDKAMSLNSRYFPAIYAKGVVAEKTKKYKEALIHFQRSLVLDPKNPTIYIDLIRVNLLENNDVEASRYLKTMKLIFGNSQLVQQAENLFPPA